ncbi:MAG: tRNA (adenosine(37)-N6)-threonylcarbamoyltransferase complex ATPase subunit type 1 TsaE [Saprospiraceae bacterium]
MTPNTLKINTLSEWPNVVRALLDYAQGRTKFVLQGEIGAGKTTLVQAFCTELGVKELVTSPTFSLINEYTYHSAVEETVQRVYHLDLYRLKSMEEALDLGIEDLLVNDAYCFIEWPELIQPLLTNDLVVIKILVEQDSSRKILFL